MILSGDLWLRVYSSQGEYETVPYMVGYMYGWDNDQTIVIGYSNFILGFGVSYGINEDAYGFTGYL